MLTVSAIVTIHERLDFLQEAIQSILNQTRPVDYIILVSDRRDAYDIVHPLLQKNMYYIQVPETLGFHQADSMNYGAMIAPTDAMFYLDDDDLLQPTYIEKGMALMEKYGIDIVYPDMELFGIDNAIVKAKTWDREFMRVSTVPFGASLMKKKVWRAIKYKPDLQYLDWDFWWSAYDMGFTASHLEEPLFKYRTHPGQRSRYCDVDLEIKKVRERHGYS